MSSSAIWTAGLMGRTLLGRAGLPVGERNRGVRIAAWPRATLVSVGWEPTEQEIEEKLIELAYVWGDIEEDVEAKASTGDNEANFLSAMLGRAFRVEATFGENGWADPCVFYELLFDVADADAREGARDIGSARLLDELIREKAQPWHTRDYIKIRTVPRSTPVEGQLCRRLGEEHPPKATPTLDDVPVEISGGAVGLVEKDGYKLTPIELPFYDALRETGLTFAVQPWIQGTDRRYRMDFLVFHDGRSVAVELDGHEWHKTKEHRSRDAERDRWFAARKIETLRWTGSQVFADPQGCVSELLNVLRAAPARA
jgi:very-short-patch-repair endonuclease